jgi:hypothetical protein
MLLFQKRSNIFVFETKFWIEAKRFQSVLKNFGPNAFVLVLLKKMFETTKRFVLTLKTLVQFETFWFCFDIIVKKYNCSVFSVLIPEQLGANKNVPN